VGLQNPALQRARALKMIEMRVSNNMTLKQVGQAFGVSERTVERVMSYAKRADLITTYQDKILTDMVPEAHRVLMEALGAGDVTVALEIYKGTPLLQKAPKGGAVGPGAAADELTRYITMKRTQAAIAEATVDGELAEPLQLTEGEAQIEPATEPATEEPA
jgi:DNA-binding transcriptional regulator LsrR (DeoR family)